MLWVAFTETENMSLKLETSVRSSQCLGTMTASLSCCERASFCNQSQQNHDTPSGSQCTQCKCGSTGRFSILIFSMSISIVPATWCAQLFNVCAGQPTQIRVLFCRKPFKFANTFFQVHHMGFHQNLFCNCLQ